MTKVLVVYYSTYGHMEIMAEAATAAANEVDGVEATLKRFAEIVPEEVAKEKGFKLDQAAPVATPDELPDYDGILFGTPTRFGNMAAQMKIFIDNCVGLWATDAMVGKVAGVFTSSAAQHGGQESTILSAHIPLLHLGFVLVGLPYSFKAQNGVDEVLGGSPYGASTIADNDGSRMPSQRDLDGVRYQARHLADVASKLAA